MITLIAITAFASGAVVGHLRALKASQQELLNAHQAGLYRGRSEQARRISALTAALANAGYRERWNNSRGLLDAWHPPAYRGGVQGQ